MNSRVLGVCMASMSTEKLEQDINWRSLAAVSQVHDSLHCFLTAMQKHKM